MEKEGPSPQASPLGHRSNISRRGKSAAAPHVGQLNVTSKHYPHIDDEDDVHVFGRTTTLINCVTLIPKESLTIGMYFASGVVKEGVLILQENLKVTFEFFFII